MSIYDLILNRRTIRKFEQKPITDEMIKKYINAARLAPSAANRQPLKYIGVVSEEKVELISLSPEEHVDKYIADGLSRMDAIKRAAKDRGMTKSQLYKILNSEG